MPEWLEAVRDLGLLAILIGAFSWLGYWMPRWVDQWIALKKVAMEMQTAQHQGDQLIRQENVKLWAESTERMFGALREEQRFMRDHYDAQHQQLMTVLNGFCRYNQTPPG